MTAPAHNTAAYWAAEARKAITEARAGMCGCGVARGKCKDHAEPASGVNAGQGTSLPPGGADDAPEEAKGYPPCSAGNQPEGEPR